MQQIVASSNQKKNSCKGIVSVSITIPMYDKSNKNTYNQTLSKFCIDSSKEIIFKKVVISLFALLCALESTQALVDTKLQTYIKQFNLKALSRPQGKKAALYELGKELFFEKGLSGNKNTSCATCHSPSSQSVDWLSFAIGEGGSGEHIERSLSENSDSLITRNTPHLFNLRTDREDQEVQYLFWDGRISFNKETHEFQTPLSLFNGPNPKRKDITSQLTSALSMQALFPLLNEKEMLGRPNSNKLAQFYNDPEKVISAIEEIIFRGELKKNYELLFKEAYPTTPKKRLSIAHLLEAIAHYEIHKFSVTNTPWDQYLRGDKTAITEQEKRGAILFLGKSNCIQCHSGNHLGGNAFESVATPSIGLSEYFVDMGRFEVTKETKDLYKFKVPSLRNIALTFPYMHNGAFFELEEIIQHYENIRVSLKEFSPDRELNQVFKTNYAQKILKTKNTPKLIQYKSHQLNTEIALTPLEKEDLLEFLGNALTDSSWDRI